MPYSHHMPFSIHMPFTDHMPGPHVPNRRWTKPKMVTVAEASVELSTAESKGDKAGKAKAMMRQANAMMRKGTSTKM